MHACGLYLQEPDQVLTVKIRERSLLALTRGGKSNHCEIPWSFLYTKGLCSRGKYFALALPPLGEGHSSHSSRHGCTQPPTPHLSTPPPPPPPPTFLSHPKEKKSVVNRGQGFQEMDWECCGQNRSMGQGKQKLYHWTKPCDGHSHKTQAQQTRRFHRKL